MTSQEMMKCKAKPGNTWVNIAHMGEAPDWQEQVKPFDWEKDTEYLTRSTLFGYDEKEFMKKQYK